MSSRYAVHYQIALRALVAFPGFLGTAEAQRTSLGRRPGRAPHVQLEFSVREPSTGIVFHCEHLPLTFCSQQKALALEPGSLWKVLDRRRWE